MPRSSEVPEDGGSKVFRSDGIAAQQYTESQPRGPEGKLIFRDSSVGIALDYGLDDRGSRVRFPAGAGNFSLYHRVQNGSGAHPASYPMGNRGSFRGVKQPGREADHSPPSSTEVKE
jgi:hypothetical protein